MELQLVEELVVEVEMRVPIAGSLRYWEEIGVAVMSSALLEPQGAQGVPEGNPNHHPVLSAQDLVNYLP
tara:strand:- start:139 stop:345 length:207 start_codon:yes stop_codon:yes gene_type:complete